ncbi:MAG: DNRLRE domain-containing protein [Phycisphaerae bacterium]
MSRWSVRFTAVAVMLVANGATRADAITLPATRDNTLFETTSGTTSNGAGTAMFAGRNSQAVDSRRRAVLMFDVASGVPAGATIDAVSLTLTNSAANSTLETVEMHRLLASWGEGTSVAASGGGSGAPASAGDATWLHRFFNGTSWTQPGGDFASTASATAGVAGPGAYDWTSTPALVSDVQSFLESPAGNFGWILIGNEAAASTAKRFSTREDPLITARPALRIDFTPIPEPTSGLYLAAALLAGGLPRRK